MFVKEVGVAPRSTDTQLAYRAALWSAEVDLGLIGSLSGTTGVVSTIKVDLRYEELCEPEGLGTAGLFEREEAEERDKRFWIGLSLGLPRPRAMASTIASYCAIERENQKIEKTFQRLYLKFFQKQIIL